MRALKEEIQLAKDEWQDDGRSSVTSVYFGGGTPSVLSTNALPEILDELRKYWQFENAEITAEANPESLDFEKLKVWREAGMNRVSIGVQSLRDDTLKTIGRLHDRSTALRAVESAVNVVGNVSCDLIAGLPFQTPLDVRNDVLTLAKLGIKHLSCYGLKVEEGTPLSLDVAKKRVILPDDDTSADAFDAAFDACSECGFSRYEVSNFAAGGSECRHNIGYWKREKYLGFGASAHSFSGENRWSNFCDLESYYASVFSGKLPRENYSSLTFEEAVFETAMLSLRLTEGIDLADFSRRFGISFWERFAPQIAAHGDCLTCDANHVRLNRRGMEIMNSILVDFLD